MFRVIVDERKKREADPTLADASRRRRRSEEARRRRRRTRASGSPTCSQFFETMTTWADQMRKMPTPAVVRMVKMGDKVAKLLG